MEYDLARIDYIVCGITYPDTLKILPSPTPGPSRQQKFAIGDKSGVLQCLSIKDEEPVVHFKTLPGKSITSLQVASTIGSQSDKIFAASGNEVKGYTRKGKVFLSLETSLTDTITSMCVTGADLILSSGRTVTYYRDLREYHSYVCEDRVLDIAVYPLPNNTRVRLLVLIANKGAVLLEGGQEVSKVAISSGPTRLIVPPASHSADMQAFYGAADGSIGIMTYEESLLSSNCLVDVRGLGSVMCMGWFVGFGGPHLAVGRHDGSIQLYLINMENVAEKPRLKFTYFCGEPVTSVAGGYVGTEESELLAVTFSGRIFALRSARLISIAASLTSMPQEALAARRAKLEAEIARLEKQTANERDKYQRSTRSIHAGLSAPPLLDIQYELSGAGREGWQELRIISPVPLDMILIYSYKKFELQTDSAAVLSICPSQDSSADLLATVRCQAGTKRLWVRLRYCRNISSIKRTESIRILVYVLPSNAPRVARLIAIRVPALPYYTQHEDIISEQETRSWCQIQISGSFSVAEMTSWLNEALPGELPRPAANVAFGRRHTLLGTVLICRYQRGQAIFKTDNISTATAIRDTVSNCSVQKSILLEISYDIPSDCVLQSFKKIEEQFKLEYQKSQDLALKKALGALDVDTISENNVEAMLCEDYLRVCNLSNNEAEADTIFYELCGTIEEWYADWRALSLDSKKYNYERSDLNDAVSEFQIDKITKILKNEL